MLNWNQGASSSTCTRVQNGHHHLSHTGQTYVRQSASDTPLKGPKCARLPPSKSMQANFIPQKRHLPRTFLTLSSCVHSPISRPIQTETFHNPQVRKPACPRPRPRSHRSPVLFRSATSLVRSFSFLLYILCLRGVACSHQTRKGRASPARQASDVTTTNPPSGARLL